MMSKVELNDTMMEQVNGGTDDDALEKSGFYAPMSVQKKNIANFGSKLWKVFKSLV